MFGFRSKSCKLFISSFVPALLIVVLTVYSFAFKPKTQETYTNLPGKPLATYNDLYPVQSDAQGHLYLDKERFVKAVKYLSATPSPKAISDLIYLGNANNIVLMLNDSEKEGYKNLISKYSGLQNAQLQYDRFFSAYKDIVNGIGQTFAGTGIEIVLHDTRNPLKSVVAIQNPISGRRLGDPTTNFGLELIKNYNMTPGQGTSFVSYGLALKDGRPIKSTTIPLFHEAYGLVGFICMNIDISQLDEKHPEAIAQFIENMKLITHNDKISELIENTKRKQDQQ